MDILSFGSDTACDASKQLQGVSRVLRSPCRLPE